MNEQALRIRIDKWLFYARVGKTRTFCQKLVRDGKIRINNERVVLPGRLVGYGDIITITGRVIRVFKILDVGVRRGPASEACLLYDDLTPPSPSPSSSASSSSSLPASPFFRVRGSGRPTKKERRQLNKLRLG